METRRAIIVPGAPFGPGTDRTYHLIAEDGEHLWAHVCSDEQYARHDLTERGDRPANLEAKGITEIVTLEESGIGEAELQERNRTWAGPDPVEVGG